MKNYLSFSICSLLLVWSGVIAGEYTDREYSRSLNYSYSSEELSLAGQKWLDFCEKQKVLLSSHEVKFARIKKTIEPESDNTNDLSLVQVGGVKVSLLIDPKMKLADATLKSKDSYFYFVLESAEEIITIQRSKIMETRSLWAENKDDIELTKKIYPEGITDTTLILGMFSVTPSDIKCTLSNADKDKRTIYLLGPKSVSLDLTKIEKVNNGSVLVKKDHAVGYVAMDFTFETNNSVYTIMYISKNDKKRESYIDEVASKVVYEPNINTYEINIDTEFQSVREHLEIRVNN